ncbi:hypothetical protein SARC_12891 [Sphaeroforma arctica JP610]|uniref:DNA-PKcs N-terminal domain-containing protein n=1 Tax=Sphaeroforma arctica JP610 TaxID=667725 RepID=A0A0L0FDP2_9EUKA|nr:hypothetical protein SARC_12891 [Sphaeroforma arctica JP610]KNC74566.1 hypothetical protein SARC_12891 [Sphaeroforma arctica JP610]|eukprot:XP_014148468.1 hypothetical protein SARC_12891 [Sphaeroforma arctica JP610]
MSRSSAICGYGYLSLPCKRFLKQEEMDVILTDIGQSITQSLAQLQASGVSSAVSDGVPSWLEAMCSIIRASGTLSVSMATSIEQLLVLTFTSYTTLGRRRKEQVIGGI